MRKKKTSEAIELKEVKSRAKYQCLPEIEELIYQANLVPIGITMPDFEAEMSEAEMSEAEMSEVEMSENRPILLAYKSLKDRIKHLPQDFLDYIESTALGIARSSSIFCASKEDYQHYLNNWLIDPLSIPPRQVDYALEFIKQYVEYCHMRDSMILLVRRLEAERRWSHYVEKINQQNIESDLDGFYLNYDLPSINKDFADCYKSPSLHWDSFPISIKTTLKRDDDEQLQITGLAALIGKFDARRLRLCEICKRIFWANYKNSFTCEKNCLNALRQRRHREKNKEEINTKRRDNYRQNKKLKEIRRIKNGTL